MLVLLVGVLRLAPGLFRTGMLIYLASPPAILGFTNAAALIIDLSLLIGLAALAALHVLRARFPTLPGVPIVVVAGTLISAGTGL